MSNINYRRYCDSITFPDGCDKKTFLNQWYRRGAEWFIEHYKKELDDYYAASQRYYDDEEAKGRYGEDIACDEEYKNIKARLDPFERHKFVWTLVKIPSLIKSWLCCGWKRYNKESRNWEYGEYHMMSKLCCRNARITWWDKLRFKWITGYEYEEE